MPMSIQRLPNPHETYFFRHGYSPEAVYDSSQKVRAHYPEQPVVMEFDGDGRRKDALSELWIHQIAALKKGMQERDFFPWVKQWFPIIRRDIHPDDTTPTNTVEYNGLDSGYTLPLLIRGEKSGSLTGDAAKLAERLLEAGNIEDSRRSKLPDEYMQTISPFEQVDLTLPLPSDKKQKKPSVRESKNILHYFDPEGREQHLQNVEDTQSEGSRFILGPSEVKLDDLPDRLQRHGYTPDREANQKIKDQKLANPVNMQLNPNERHKPTYQYVYIKTRQ
ncbi:MAG: hypothetical protein K0Q50_1090 [Vampirovibrio sp.]|nr:hypothetical protein [Vampirovibrio sp.]